MAISTLVPLIVLAAGSEAVLALYMNVERIGRYLQAFQEPSTETLDAQFQSTLQCLPHPSRFFQSSIAGMPMEIGVIVIVHCPLINRIRLSRQPARSERTQDLEHFQTMARPEV